MQKRPQTRNPVPNAARVGVASLAALGLAGVLTAPAQAAQGLLPQPGKPGLVAPEAQQLWPRWQARVTVQVGAARSSDEAIGVRGLTGGSLLGDYTFARPFFGSFRASGGVLMGHQGGMPLGGSSVASTFPGLGWAVLGSAASLSNLHGANQTLATAEVTSTVPYLGLGFSSPGGLNGWSMNADLGWVSESSAASGLGRALFGNQGFDQARRELRLSPVLQLGLRYSF